MCLFEDPEGEVRFFTTLKAFVEEWGPEYVIVAVLKSWSSYNLLLPSPR